jgi:hypothetical protein
VSTTTIFDPPRYSYRQALVEKLNSTLDPEIQRANADITKWTEQINRLQQQIDDARKYIGEIRQLQQHTVENADLPMPVPAPPPSLKCRSCDQPVVQLGDGRWTHAGRELIEHGERCDPKHKQSPVAEPLKGPAQAFGDWSDALNEERAGGLS